MLFAAVLGIAAGFVAGGSTAHLGTRRVRGIGFALLWGALVLITTRDWIPGAFGVYVLSFICALIFVAINVRALPGLVVVGVGLALNLTVVLVNQGMPFSAEAMRAADISRPEGSIIVATPQRHIQTEADRLYPLIDHLPVAAGPIREVLSPGDVLVALGLGLTCCTALLPARRRKPAGELVPIVRSSTARPPDPRRDRPAQAPAARRPQPLRAPRGPEVPAGPAPVPRSAVEDDDLDIAGDVFWEARNRFGSTSWRPDEPQVSASLRVARTGAHAD